MLSGCRNCQEGQSLSGSECGNTCEHQHGGFPQGQQQQKEDQRKRGPKLKWAGSPVTKDTGVVNDFFTFLITELALSHLREEWENSEQSTFGPNGG